MNKIRISFIVLCSCMVVCLITYMSCGEGAEGLNGWGVAQLIETDDSVPVWDPQVEFDGSGNAIAIWSHGYGPSASIYSNRYVAGTGWGTAKLVETLSGSAYNPQIGFDGSGNAIAVWSQWDGTTNSIYSNRYVTGTGWGTAKLIKTDDSGDAVYPQVDVDGSGNAIVVWSQSNGTRSNIYSNRYIAGTGWGTAKLIETDDSGDAVYPQVGVDGSGNAVAVWYYDSQNNIWANRYVVGSGWGTAQLIEIGDGIAREPQVGVDSSGNAVAVWRQWDGPLSNIYSNRYVADTGWNTAQLIEIEDGYARNPQVGVDGNGNAIVVWQQVSGTIYNIYSNRYVAGTGWGTAQLIETDNNGQASSPQVGVDSSGNAVAVWVQWNGVDQYIGRFSIWSNHYVVGSGWGTAQLIDPLGYEASFPQVGVGESGNAVAVWVASNGRKLSVWASTRQ